MSEQPDTWVVTCPVCGSRDEYPRPNPGEHTCGHTAEADGTAIADGALSSMLAFLTGMRTIQGYGEFAYTVRDLHKQIVTSGVLPTAWRDAAAPVIARAEQARILGDAADPAMLRLGAAQLAFDGAPTALTGLLYRLADLLDGDS